jgi:benzoate/toluate 1,2-dioxygenase subunit alpha
VQRLYARNEAGQRNVVTDGTSEWQMRNQFRAWAKFMTMGL